MLDFFNNPLQAIQDYRQGDITNPGRVVLVFSEEADCPNPTCGWNELSGSGKRIDCPTCKGVGKIQTYVQQQILVRVTWVSQMMLNYIAPTPGVQMGDVLLGFGEPDLESITRVQENKRSYIIVDDQTVRPVTIQKMVLPKVGGEWNVNCRAWRPPG